MSTKDILARGLAVVAIVIAIIGVFTPAGKQAFGTIYDTFSGDYFNATQGFQINGVTVFSAAGLKPSAASTPLLGENFGTCQVQSNANTIAASTTQTVDCVAVAGTPPGTALAGITAGDKITMQESTTTSTAFGGVLLLGASASSTSGYITMKLYNATGATFTWTSAASTSFQYFAAR